MNGFRILDILHHKDVYDRENGCLPVVTQRNCSPFQDEIKNKIRNTGKLDFFTGESEINNLL